MGCYGWSIQCVIKKKNIKIGNLSHLFPIRTSGEQYSMVPQNVQNFFPSSM